MSQWFIKNFRKNSIVKCLLLLPDRRIKTFYAIPKNKVIQYGGMAFIVNEKDFFMSKNTPTYIYDINNVEPKEKDNKIEPSEMYDKKTLNNVMSPVDFDTAISARVAKEIFEVTSNKMDKNTINIMLTIGAIGIIAVVGYMLSKKMDTILEAIENIKNLLELIGGIS